MKKSESKLRSARSEENLTHHVNNNQTNSVNGINGDSFNCETQSLDSELTDVNRSSVNGDDADIWSTNDDSTGDDLHQQSASRRNGLTGYRSNHSMNINPETQSILSTESHLSQQEIMASEIRKRLTEVKTTGPILFDVELLLFVVSESHKTYSFY